MNIFYNNEVFKDTIASKKKLWEKISKELEAGRIQIDKDNLPKVQEAVFGDNPCDASQYLRYGQVEALPQVRQALAQLLQQEVPPVALRGMP